MRKCHFCSAVVGLKAIWTDDMDGIENHCCCRNCFFDNELENASEVNRENWGLYNYDWKLKTTIRRKC